MPSSTPSQRGASRSGRSSSPSKGKSTGGASARARTRATTSSSPRKPRTSRARNSGTARAQGGARRTASRAAAPARRGGFVPASIAIGLILLAWSMYPALRVQYQTSRRVADLQAQYDALSTKNKTLRAQVAELKFPAGVERAAREDLGLTKPGENVYVVMPSTAASSTAASAGQARPATDIVTSLLDAIFGSGQ